MCNRFPPEEETVFLLLFLAFFNVESLLIKVEDLLLLNTSSSSDESTWINPGMLGTVEEPLLLDESRRSTQERKGFDAQIDTKASDIQVT